MVVTHGDIWWATLPDPRGSEPGYRRPVLVVQGDALNRSRIKTIVCVPLTSQAKWSEIPGNVRLDTRATGLTKDSVAIVSQIITLDRSQLIEQAGQLTGRKLERVLDGMCALIGR